MREKDYYKILGLSDSDRKLQGKEWEDRLTKAFRSNAKKWHPDRFGNKSESEKKQAEEKMKLINEAYDTLKDPRKRQAYDSPFGGGFGGGFGDDFGGFDPFAGFNPFGESGHMGGRRRNTPPKGEDIILRINIGIDEILNGCQKKIKYRRNVRCSHCHGKGGRRKVTCPYCHGTGRQVITQQTGPMSFYQQSVPCPHCKGEGFKFEEPCDHCDTTGFETKEEIVTVVFGPRISADMAFKAVGKGHQSPDEEGADGNLIAYPVFTYDENVFNLDNLPHIIKKVKLDWKEALLGGKKEFDLEGRGRKKVTIPECTKPGDFIRLRELGAEIKTGGDPFLKNQGKGDYILQVEYDIPYKLSRDERKALESLTR